MTIDWYDKGLFEVEPNKNKKYYMLFAYPTVSGTLHVGHARSYTLPDVIARYKRLKGYNVFFPLGFHATGIDCLKIMEKISNPEECEKYGIPVKDAANIKTAHELEKYLEKRIIKSLKSLGISLDFRAVVSTIDEHYNKFVQWQFRKFREAGFIVQRDYRLAWCPKCNNPVSLDPAEADISEWKGAQIKDYVIIKFKTSNTILPAATMRPETIFGVTNIWINVNEKYIKAKVGNEEWILSEPSIKKLQLLGKDIKVLGIVEQKDIVGKQAINPVTGAEIPIIGAEFVDINEATGIVMSVPAHDPFDYLWLKKKADNIKPIQVVEINGFGSTPAAEMLERYKIKDVSDRRIEDVMKELYRLEFNGKMIGHIERFGGMPVSLAKNEIIKWMDSQGISDRIYEFSIKPLHCRCGTEIVIKSVAGQWFIDYGNRKWKALANEAIEKMNIFPPEYKKELPSIIEWLDARPCVRKRGLGTPYPFEDGWIIEALSDSTIYMAFFIITKYFNQKKITLSEMTDEFFDYVYLGKGRPKTRIWEQIRKEFEYWYPLDLNAGGKEHKSVHFPFFIFHHTAIFPKEFWPKGIFLNWHLVAEGKKMSKHLGNVVFLDEAIKKYGADAIRLYLCHGANQWADFNWKNNEIESYTEIFKNIITLFKDLWDNSRESKKDHIANWLNSRLNHIIELVDAAMEKNEIKTATDLIFFQFYNDIKWYKRRASKYMIRDILSKWLILMSSFIPFSAEELWKYIGGKNSINMEKWPTADSKAINIKLEKEEELIKNIITDINQIKKIIKKDINQIKIYVAEQWKYDVWNMFVRGEKLNNILKNSTIKQPPKKITDFYIKLEKRHVKDEVWLTAAREYKLLNNAREFLQKEFQCNVEIYRGDEILKNKNVPSEIEKKISLAEPMKVGILVE